MANGDEQLGLLGRVGQAFSGGSQFSPLLSIGAGLLSASGPSATPTSFGQRLGQGLGAAGQFQQQMLQNQALRQEMQERARRREAQQRLFEPRTSVDMGLLPTPQQIIAGQDVGDLSGAIQEQPSAIQGLLSGRGTSQDLGLLSQAFPDQTGQILGGLLGGQQRAEPSDVRTVRAMGFDPESEEGRELLRQSFTSGQDQLGRALDFFKLQQLQREGKEEEAQKQEQNIRRKQTVTNNISRALELAELNEQRRQFVSDPTSAISNPLQSLSTTQRFNQLTNELVLEGGLQPLKDVEERMTDAGREALFSSKFSSTTAPDVVDSVLADKLEGLLQAADIVGAEVPNREAVRQRINDLRQRGASGGGNDASERPRRQGRGNGGGETIDLGDGVKLRFD